MLEGQSIRSIADQFKISEGALRKRFSTRVQTIKVVANQMLIANNNFQNLPTSSKISTQDYFEKLRDMQNNLIGAASNGAATSHRLSAIANQQVQKLDDADPMTEAGISIIKGIAALTRTANEASEIAINLIKANKDVIDDINASEMRKTKLVDINPLPADAIDAGREYLRIMQDN